MYLLGGMYLLDWKNWITTWTKTLFIRVRSYVIFITDFLCTVMTADNLIRFLPSIQIYFLNLKVWFYKAFRFLLENHPRAPMFLSKVLSNIQNCGKAVVKFFPELLLCFCIICFVICYVCLLNIKLIITFRQQYVNTISKSIIILF